MLKKNEQMQISRENQMNQMVNDYSYDLAKKNIKK